MPQGFVFLMTLIMLAVVSLFLLSSQQKVFLYFHAHQQISQRAKNLYTLEDVAAKLMLNPDATCHISESDFTAVRVKLLQGEGCLWKNGHDTFRYNLHDLGAYPCMRIKSSGGLLLGTHHWLITITLLSKPSLLLQERVALPEVTVLCETHQQSIIHSNILSWMSGSL